MRIPAISVLLASVVSGALLVGGCSGEAGGPVEERTGYTTSALGGDGGATPCTAAGMTPSPASPQSPGTAVTWTATSASCPSPQYEFWVLAAGGGSPWQIAQAWSSSPTFDWSTTGDLDGTYALEVWARDASSSSNYDSYADTAYTLQGSGAACASGSLTSSPSASAAAGTLITFTGSAAACSSPQYEFWTLAPGGASGWTIAQPWSNTATFAWNTKGLALGTYQVEVWIKDATSNTTGYDTYDGVSFDLTASTTCAGGTLTASPASSQAAGTSVTLSATTQDCGSPEYEFWVLAPGGQTGWTVAQAWSSQSTYAWTTTGLAPGDYAWEVWIKDAGSSMTSYDAYAAIDDVLTAASTSPPCTGVTLSASPAAPQPQGSAVTFTASASSCSPQYELWALAPDGQTGWTVVQPYTSSNTFTWTGDTEIGTYQFEVWARGSSSTPTYDVYTSLSYVVVAGTGQDAGAGDAGAGDATTGDATTSDGGCTPVTLGCSGVQPQLCVANGTWENIGAPCSGSTPACLNGACVVCIPGSTQCIYGSEVETCGANEQWEYPVSCGTGETCQAGACVCTHLCGGTCVDSQTDPNNCGGCGISCAGAACVSGVCQAVTLADNQSGAYDIAIDSSNVYWFESGLNEVVRCGIGGCNDTPSVVASGISPALENAQGALVADANNLYWATTVGAVAQCAKTGCGTSPTVLATGGQFYAAALAVDSTSIYWNNPGANGSILRCAIGGCGGAPTVLASGQYGPSNVVVSGGQVYWVTTQNGSITGSVLTCPVSGCGGAPTVLGSGLQGSPGPLVLAGSSLYFPGNNGTVVGVLQCAVTGCGTPSFFANNNGIDAMTTDGTALYWGTPSLIWRAYLSDGGEYTTVGAGASELAVDATWVYWPSSPMVRKQVKVP